MELKPYMSHNFVARLVVDCSQTEKIRASFFSGGEISEEDVALTEKIIPSQKSVESDTLSMVSWVGIQNVIDCIESTIKDGINGDFIETGVWRGGICIIAKSTYDHYGINKKVFVADSFKGLPPPDPTKYPQDAGDDHHTIKQLCVSIEVVKSNFNKFNLLDDNVIFLEGWFKDTLPTAPIDKLSILRLDGDMYESTMDSLSNLYHKLSVGGYCIIDDYNHKGCIAAVNDFRSQNDINEPIIKVDPKIPYDEVHFWRKER